MRIGVLAAGAVPNPTTGGGALTQWTVLRWLVERGHEVTLFHLESDVFADPSGVSREDRLAAVEALGARIVPVEPTVRGPLARGSVATRVRRFNRPRAEELFPEMRQADAVRTAFGTVKPQAAWVYHFEALAGSRGLRGIVPRAAAVGDPPHLPRLHHWRLRPSVHGGVRLLSTLAWQPRLARGLLRECESAGAFAAHHARQLGVEYLRTPVPDPSPTTRRERPRPTVLLIGHLAGAVTLEGLRVFRSVLPQLERENVEVRVVGGHEPPEWLRESPAVVLAGHREDATEELVSAHALVVPTSIPLGVRVRVITAWSHGTPVVAHAANAQGIPELVHEDNALLAASPDALAREILRAVGDEALRTRLGASGRSTYERAFAPEVAAAAVEERLRSVAR